MWDYAVETVRKAFREEGIHAAERKAADWQRNLGFDKFKLMHNMVLDNSLHPPAPAEADRPANK